ncbi:hypothetical protein GCM10018987_12260 [Streptomyces cremeus]
MARTSSPAPPGATSREVRDALPAALRSRGGNSSASATHTSAGGPPTAQGPSRASSSSTSKPSSARNSAINADLNRPAAWATWTRITATPPVGMTPVPIKPPKERFRIRIAKHRGHMARRRAPPCARNTCATAFRVAPCRTSGEFPGAGGSYLAVSRDFPRPRQYNSLLFPQE